MNLKSNLRSALRASGALAILAFALCVVAPADAAESVRAANAWVRPPVAGQTIASAYVELTSPTDAVLVGAGSAAAGRVEMHSMTMDGGVMRMRALPKIDLPAGQTVKLAPGGLHLMLIDVKQPLKAGDRVPLVLSIQPGGPSAGMSLTTLNLQAEVRPATGSGAHKQH